METLELPEISRRFAEEYVVDFNPGRAAVRAGASAARGAEMLRDPRVVALVKDWKRKVSDSLNISASMVLETLRIIASVEVLDARSLISQNDDGMPFLDIKKLSEEQRVAVKGFKWTKEGPQIEFHSKMEATKLLGQYFSLFKEGVEISGPGGAPVSITSDMTPRDAAEAYRQMIEGK